MEDELDISKSALHRLMPWFDDVDELEQWAIQGLLSAADGMRLNSEPPPGWRNLKTRHRRRDSLRYVETSTSPIESVLLFDLVPAGVTLLAAWPRSFAVGVTRHARERLRERLDELEPDTDLQHRWLVATVDRALRTDRFTLDAPRWAASAPLRPGFGWVTRRLRDDEIALLVGAPHQAGGRWNIVTVLTRSTAISTRGRFARRWKRATRRIVNRIRYRSSTPVRERATRPPRLGDVTPRRSRHHRNRRR